MLRTRELIQLLFDAGFEFVIVGGIAAIAHGSVELSDDLDVVSPFTTENLRRLMVELTPHHPRYALTTDLGRLDVLSSVTAVGSYEEVLGRAVTMPLFERPCRVIALDDLIVSKAAIGRPKDKHVELELRAIRDKLARDRG